VKLTNNPLYSPLFMKQKINFTSLWESYGTWGMLVLVTLAFGIMAPQYFLTSETLVQVLLQSSVNILVACGVFFAILIAGIDLSVGSIVGLTGMLTAQLMVAGVHPLIAILLGGILAGAVIGAINGCIVNITKLHPFIITLGMQVILRGVTLTISNARPVFGFPQSFAKNVAGWIGPIPIPVIIAAAVALILVFITKKTKLGRNIYALGGNSQSAWFSGINVKLHTLIVFIISGVCCGIAGVVLTARVGAAEPSAGAGFETFAIASAIIGGTSFFGGKGNISGVVVGGLIIGVISSGLNIMNVSSYYQQIVMGTLIILTVTLDRLFAGNRKN
jgi:D-allose transport system permease protein